MLTYAQYLSNWQPREAAARADYTDGKTSYIVGLSPQRALGYTTVELADILEDRLSPETFRRALDPDHREPGHLDDRPDGDWLKSCHTVGVNVRTIGSFWNLLKYALTLPDHIRGIHLLPIWEPGVMGSLYGMASWNLNEAFLDREALRMFPRLGTAENQLKVTVNLLHAMGKVVGMDVNPHTERYSEIVLANPAYFEWVHRENLHEAAEAAEAAILDWLQSTRPGVAVDRTTFFTHRTEAERLELLFGAPQDYNARLERRVNLVDFLYHRGLEVDSAPGTLTVDEAGHQAKSRVFGPLTRYKFYHNQDNNRDCASDFDRPRPEVWHYFTEKYAEQQSRYGFDFMRAAMSHEQMRPAGVPDQINDWYDPLRTVKRRVARDAPHFGYLADTFPTDADTLSYGDEVEHLMASEAEVTLGNLQGLVAGTKEFQEALASYLEIAEVTPVTPAFTVITGQKDDPRFDHLHHHGEVARFFTGLFLGRLPLYYSLGFEQRDRHFSPAANEAYTKHYVIQERKGPNAVSGPWQWGQNLQLFQDLQSIHQLAAKWLPRLGAAAGAVQVDEEGGVHWLRYGMEDKEALLFVVNFAAVTRTVALTPEPEFSRADLLFAWPETDAPPLAHHDGQVTTGPMAGGAVRCYRMS